MVQDLLNTLRMTHEPQTGLRNQLADKLEANFQNMHTPPPVSPTELSSHLPLSLSWSIFDQMSLQFPYLEQWPIQQPLPQLAPS
jgi:hypothetical protein